MDLVRAGDSLIKFSNSLSCSPPPRSLLPFNGVRARKFVSFVQHSSRPSPARGNASLSTQAKKRNNDYTQKRKQIIEEDEDGFEEFEVDEEEIDELSDEEIIMDGGEDYEDDFDFEDFEDETEADRKNVYIGDGGDGGGTSLAGAAWDREALALAEEVSEKSFNGDLKIYAFKTSPRLHIYVRIEKLSSRYGSPSMSDIEAFTIAYREQLDKAESDGKIPPNTSLEVSSPGVERVIRVPEDLERFKDRPMYVKYITDGGPHASDSTPPKESEGILRLISYDTELCECTWGIADVKINRQQSGKGRPLSKKQREWRLQTPFDCLRLVRIYSDC